MRLETARTIIRGWGEAAIPAYAQIVADPMVMRFIGDGSMQHAAQAAAFVHHCMQQELARGWIPWAVAEKATGALMGWCGFGLREGHIDFGYRFARQFWGQGIGTEVAQAVLAYGMEQYQFARCTAVAFVENIASIRILAKLGFQVERSGELYGKRVAHYTYAPR